MKIIHTRGALVAILGASLLISGCSRLRDHQGFIIPEEEAAAIKPGIDTKQTVQAALGRPSFTGQFDDADWYYVSRATKALGFTTPEPYETTVLHIRFDPAGTVAAIDRGGMERVASIDPSGDKTPTLGRDRSFWEELFGNLGRVGSTPTGASPQ